MSRRPLRRTGPGPLDLIEEAVHLLRLSSWTVLGLYYLGSLPFLLGLLYFWADMSRGSAAYDRCAPGAAAVSVLFLWMKTWQAFFVRRLKAQITSRPAQDLTLSGFFRTALNQTIVQPSALFLLPLSLLAVLPFGWAYAFYQSVTAFAAEDGASAKHVFRRAARQAQLWPRQNHLLLALLLLFGLVIFLDVAIGLAAAPSLLKMLLGIESAFTRSPWALLNTTFLATVGALTYLCFDPLVKAVYLLRCFYGESLDTGEDLSAELRQFLPGTAAIALLMVVLGFQGLAEKAARMPAAPGRLGVAAMADATQSPRQTTERQTTASEIAPPDLDRSIEQVLSRREFNWRLPRERPSADESEKGFFAAFMDGLIETLRSWAKAIGKAAKAVARWVGDALEWLRDMILGRRVRTHEGGSAGTDWMVALQGLIFILLVLAACAIAILFWRTWRSRGARKEIASEAVAAVPDVADEDVIASQLPEDDWLRLARELMSKGDLRLALRAFYLAGLAHLAQREMIRVAKFKSNRDYDQELRRRARALPELQVAFSENVGIFDRVWYGLHEVTHETLERFQINLEKIKAC